MRTYKFNHPEETTSALDKWVSWDVPRKQFYYFTIFAHNFYPLKPALILPINDSPVASVPGLFTPNFKKSSGHRLKLCMMEIFTHHQKYRKWYHEPPGTQSPSFNNYQQSCLFRHFPFPPHPSPRQHTDFVFAGVFTENPLITFRNKNSLSSGMSPQPSGTI